MSEYRTWALAVLLVVVALSLGAVGTGAAEHGGEANESEIVEVQTITDEGTEQGRIQVELSYHLGEEIASFEVTVTDDTAVAADLDGFTTDSGETFEWDETTEQPSITLTRDANQSSARFSGVDFVQTNNWTMAGLTPTNIVFSAVDPESIEREVHVRSDDPDSVGGQTMVYLGEYERHTFASETEQFQLVEAAAADPELSTAEIETGLVTASGLLDVGGTADHASVFVVTDPIRPGGLTSGESSDFWVHDGGVAPGKTTLFHEYVHTRQVDQRARAAEWSHEAEAEFYGQLLAVQTGNLEYHQFYDALNGTETIHGNAVLSEVDTWAGTRANYELGASVIAALDARIKDQSTNSYLDVLRAKNDHDGEVTASDLEQFASEAAGTDLSAFFERYVDSHPRSVAVPGPTTYEGPSTDADLELTASDTAIEPGDDGVLEFTLTNTGSEESRTPAIEPALPDPLQRGTASTDSDRGVFSPVTTVDGVAALNHLAPGETVVVEQAVSVPADTDFERYSITPTVTDLGGNEATATATVDVTSTPDAALDAPDAVPAGESTTLDASASSDDEGITSYRWAVGGETTETTDPQLEYTFEGSGEQTVTLTVENTAGVTNTDERTILVSDKPVVTVDAPDRIDPGETAVFNATVTNEIGSYEVHWQVGEDSFQADVLEYTFRNPGEREVVVTVEDEYGATTTETITVTVTGETTSEGDSVGPGFGVVAAVVALGLLAARARQ